MLLVFKTWQVAEKGPDRTYAKPDALALLKRKGAFMSFLT